MYVFHISQYCLRPQFGQSNCGLHTESIHLLTSLYGTQRTEELSCSQLSQMDLHWSYLARLFFKCRETSSGNLTSKALPCSPHPTQDFIGGKFCTSPSIHFLCRSWSLGGINKNKNLNPSPPDMPNIKKARGVLGRACLLMLHAAEV